MTRRPRTSRVSRRLGGVSTPAFAERRSPAELSEVPAVAGVRPRPGGRSPASTAAESGDEAPGPTLRPAARRIQAIAAARRTATAPARTLALDIGDSARG